MAILTGVQVVWDCPAGKFAGNLLRRESVLAQARIGEWLSKILEQPEVAPIKSVIRNGLRVGWHGEDLESREPRHSL